MEKSALDCEDMKKETDEDSIPLADDDASAIVEDESDANQIQKLAANWQKNHESLDSIPSMISDSLPVSAGPSSLIGLTASHVSEQMNRLCLDPDFSPDEAEEKARLISQVSRTIYGPICARCTVAKNAIFIPNPISPFSA